MWVSQSGFMGAVEAARLNQTRLKWPPLKRIRATKGSAHTGAVPACVGDHVKTYFFGRLPSPTLMAWGMMFR
jgi:hypothetical protein